MKWGLSVLDWRSHAIDERRYHPVGVYKAECGHLLTMVVALEDRPNGKPCPGCSAGVSHLLASNDALIPGRWGAHSTLCGVEVRRPGATAAEHDDDDPCGPPDFRYCTECVREAVRFSAEASDRASDPVR